MWSRSLSKNAGTFRCTVSLLAVAFLLHLVSADDTANVTTDATRDAPTVAPTVAPTDATSVPTTVAPTSSSLKSVTKTTTPLLSLGLDGDSYKDEGAHEPGDSNKDEGDSNKDEGDAIKNDGKESVQGSGDAIKNDGKESVQGSGAHEPANSIAENAKSGGVALTRTGCGSSFWVLTSFASLIGSKLWACAA